MTIYTSDETRPDWECSGYSVVVRNRSGQQHRLGITSGWNELRWLGDGISARDAAKKYLQEVCDEANAVLAMARTDC